MASLGHIAIGMAAGRRFAGRETPLRHFWPAAIYFSILAMAPDLDVIGFLRGVPYGSEFGHRGAAHSLLAAVAIGALAAALLPSLATRVPGFQQASFARLILWSIAIVATHGLLDTLTDGGRGVALFWPFTNHRFFAPWRPIPVAPIGARMLSERGLYVMLIELLEFLPLLVYALWPRRKITHSNS